MLWKTKFRAEFSVDLKICECVKIGVKTADVNVWRVPVPEDMIVI